MTKSTQRARDASKPESATKPQKNKKRTSGLTKAGKAGIGIPRAATHQPLDVTPEEFFRAWSREDKEALVEILIDELDRSEPDPDLEETGDAEPSAGFDDPELDNADDEPSLGWTVDGVLANGGGNDREADDSYVTEAARQRYKPFDRYTSNGNRDGKHVDTERGFGYAKRLTNLSDQQRAAVAPRLNRDEVRI